MRKRRNLNTRINPPSNISQEIDYNLPPFHETFPIKLIYKDGKDDKVCYFMCKEHLQSYISRHKLKKNQVKIEKTPPRNGEH